MSFFQEHKFVLIAGGGVALAGVVVLVARKKAQAAVQQQPGTVAPGPDLSALLQPLQDLAAKQDANTQQLASLIGAQTDATSSALGSLVDAINTQLKSLTDTVGKGMGGLATVMADIKTAVADAAAKVDKAQASLDALTASVPSKDDLYYAIGKDSVMACWRGGNNFDATCLKVKGDKYDPSGGGNPRQALTDFASCISGGNIDFVCVGKKMRGVQ